MGRKPKNKVLDEDAVEFIDGYAEEAIIHQPVNTIMEDLNLKPLNNNFVNPQPKKQYSQRTFDIT